MFVVLLKLEGLCESVALHLHGLIQASFAVENAFKVDAFIDSFVLDLARKLDRELAEVVPRDAHLVSVFGLKGLIHLLS